MAIISIVIPDPVKQFFGDDGKPLAGGLVYAYAAASTTKQDTYSDAALTSANANPVVLDANGKAAIYLQPLNYKFDVQTAAGVSLSGYPRDNIAGSLWPGLINAQGTLAPIANADGYANQFSATINKNTTGTHALFAAHYFAAPTIGAGASSLTKASTVYIAGPPTVGTTVYALEVASGNVSIAGVVSGAAVWNATKIGLAYGGTNLDMTATGGTSQFLKQNTVGGTPTLTKPATTDLSDVSQAAVTFAATNFTALTGLWTLQSGDQAALNYLIVGKMMTVTWELITTTVSATPSELGILIPAGKICNREANNAFLYLEGATTAAGIARIDTAGTTIRLLKTVTGGVNWATGTDNLYLSGQITFEIQ